MPACTAGLLSSTTALQAGEVQAALLETPILRQADPAAPACRARLWYHAHGPDRGNLTVYRATGTGQLTPVWTAPRLPHTEAADSPGLVTGKIRILTRV